MCKFKSKNALLFAGLILLFFLTANTTSTRASHLSDPINDVWAQQMGTKGDFFDSIDITQVNVQGSSITIEVEGIISPLDSGVNRRYVVLFSDDGDPTDFEAAILLVYQGPNDREAFWVVVDNDVGPDYWDVGEGWTSYGWSAATASHFVVNENQVTFFFPEFSGVSYATVVAFTMAKETNIYYDWTPDFYEFTWRFKASYSAPIKVMPGPTPMTTITSIPQETTTTSYEESITSSPESTKPSPIPGFDVIPVLAAIPFLLWLRRRYNR